RNATLCTFRTRISYFTGLPRRAVAGPVFTIQAMGAGGGGGGCVRGIGALSSGCCFAGGSLDGAVGLDSVRAGGVVSGRVCAGTGSFLRSGAGTGSLRLGVPGPWVVAGSALVGG